MDRLDWIQKSFLRFVCLVSSITTESQLLSQACIDCIRETVEALKERGFFALNAEAAHATLIVRQLTLGVTKTC